MKKNNTIDKNKRSKSVTDDVKKLESLQKQVTELQKALDSEKELTKQLKEKLMKALADYQNLEKNNQKRIDMMSLQLRKNLAKSLIEIADSLYFALNALSDVEISEQLQNWLEGLKQTLEKFNSVLSVIGVVQINVQPGDKFDSVQHEAIATLPQGEEDTIHEIVQPGYSIGEHVIRPARVVVNKGSNKKRGKED